MKKVFFLFLIITSACLAQYESQFVTGPMGVAGGAFCGVSILNSDDINAMLKKNNFPMVDNNIFIVGGGGIFYMPAMAGFRVGGLGFSGSKNYLENSSGKEVRYSVGGGGLIVDYILPIPSRILFSIGTVIGYGSTDLEIYQNPKSIDWNNVNYNSINKKFSNKYLMLVPSLTVDIPIHSVLRLRINGGYHLALFDKWEVDNNVELTNSPKSPSNGFQLTGGIYLGLFF